MGIFTSLNVINIKNLALNDPKAWDPSLWNLIGAQSLSGENVTESTALTYSAFWCAVLLIAGTVSTLPLQLLRKQDNKTLQAREFKLYNILHDRFNPYMTAQQGREIMMAHLLIKGNCYAEKVFNRYGEIIELWPIPSGRVRPYIDDKGIPQYEISIDNKKYDFSRETILHIPGLCFDGIQGISVVAVARKSLGLSMAMETFGSLFFGQGTHPGVIVKHPNKLSPEGHSNLKKSLTDVYSSLGQSHRLMLLEDGMDIEKIGIPPEDSQFLQSRQFQISEVARWFNLPPHKLKDLSKSSFNNIESEQISFVTDSILPWLIRKEQNYNLQLLTEDQVFKQNLFTRHNVEGLLRGDSKSRSEYYRIMFNIGAMSPNDIRDKENMDPVEGGDKRFVPMNMVPLGKVNDYFESQKNKSSAIPTEKPENKQIETKKRGKI